jgi:hypothetical protein
LSIEEVADLFAYLRGQPSTDVARKAPTRPSAPRAAVKPRSRVAR